MVPQLGNVTWENAIKVLIKKFSEEGLSETSKNKVIICADRGILF